ncbi:hypothetical protein HN011_007758, partial [Eciton burchellii]
MKRLSEDLRGRTAASARKLSHNSRRNKREVQKQSSLCSEEQLVLWRDENKFNPLSVNLFKLGVVRFLDIPAQVPPLTPGTNKKMTEALEASFASWEKERLRLNITKDPRQWSEAAVAHWLHWAIGEFSLEGVAMQPWQHMTGKQICAMGKESFLARAPAFMGDILWEHLEILQNDVDAAKASLENVPANLYESVCVPDLGDLLGYQGGGGHHQVATPEHKNPSTPASSATSNSSGPPQSATQQQPPIQPSSGAVSLPSRQYHND